MTIKNLSLKLSLAIFFGLLGFSATVLVGLISTNMLTNTTEAKLITDFERLRDSAIASVSEWIDERVSDIAVFSHIVNDVAGDTDFRRPTTQLTSELHDYMDKYIRSYGYYGIAIIDLDTNNFLVSKFKTAEISHPPIPKGFEKLNNSSARTYISDVFLDPETRSPLLAIARTTPQKNYYIATFLDLEKDLYPLFVGTYSLGKTGEILLVSEDGIAQSPLKFQDNATANYKINAAPATRAAAGETSIMTIEDYRGVKVHAAYGHIPILRWGLVAKQDTDELLAPISEIKTTIATVVVFISLLSLALGGGVSIWLSKPAADIAKYTTLMANGAPDTSIPVTGPRELRGIANNINRLYQILSDQNSIQENLSQLYSSGSSKNRLSDMINSILPVIMSGTNSVSGAVYIRLDKTSIYSLETFSGCDKKDIVETFETHPSNNWLSNAVTEKTVKRLSGDSDLPLPIMLTTSHGAVSPFEIIAIPILSNTEPIALITLSSLTKYSSTSLSLANNMILGLGQIFVASFRHEEVVTQQQEMKILNTELEQKNIELEKQSSELTVRSSELSQLAVELEAKSRQVEKADRLKSEFLANMSHELRTPLNSVLALSQLMIQKSQNRKAEETEYLRIIERNGQQLLSLINNILDLSKIEAGQVDVNFRHFQLSSILNEAISTVGVLIDKKDVKFESDVAKNVELFSDGDKVRQVVLNLLSNAIKFTKKGKISLKISRTLDATEVSVADTGIGISDKDLSKIFNEFEQIDGTTTRNFEGTGLGLAISKKLARLIGADLAVISEKGKGSVFTLAIPNEPDAELIERYRTKSSLKSLTANPIVSNESESSLTLESDTDFDSRQKNILVVDDNSIARNQIGRLLGEAGYISEEAASGEDALKLIADHSFDAIILDIMMPEINGFDVLNSLRATEKNKALPVLVITAKEITPEERNILHDNNVHELIQKGSIEKEEVLKKLRLVINGSHNLPAKVSASLTDQILIVEDNDDNFFTLEAILKPLNKKILRATNGIDAVIMAKEQTPSLIIMDIQLPKLSGLEACKQIKADDSTKQVPILALTAHATDDDIARSKEYGFAKYMTKPVNPETISKEVKKYIKS